MAIPSLGQKEMGLDHTNCSGFAKSPWAIDCPVMPVAPTMKTLSFEDILMKEVDVMC